MQDELQGFLSSTNKTWVRPTRCPDCHTTMEESKLRRHACHPSRAAKVPRHPEDLSPALKTLSNGKRSRPKEAKALGQLSHEFEVVALTPYQYRVEGIVDVYPKGHKYFDLESHEWGKFYGKVEKFVRDYVALKRKQGL